MEQFRKSPRVGFLDYDNGDYFITICTKNKVHYFGDIYNGEMHLSALGKFVETQLGMASTFNKGIDVPVFTVMPNHIHAIVCIKCRDMPLACSSGDAQQRSPNPSLRVNPAYQRHVPALSRYISSLKGAVSKFAKSNGHDFDWQPRFHDHYIRGSHDGNRIAEYIINNVARWQEDCFNQDEIQI